MSVAKLRLSEVMSDVKDAYVSASGDTDSITYGNIASKVGSLGNIQINCTLLSALVFTVTEGN